MTEATKKHRLAVREKTRHQAHRHQAHFMDELAAVGRMMPLSAIEPDAFQPRSAMGKLDELVASIRDKGILEPILVRPVPADPDGVSGPRPGFRIISGERRYWAAQEAGLYEVPVIEMDVSEEEALEIALIESIQRKDLTPFEEAEGYRALAERHGYTHEEIAEAVGTASNLVAESLALLQMPSRVRDAVYAQGITLKSLLLEAISNVAAEKEPTAMVRRRKRHEVEALASTLSDDERLDVAAEIASFHPGLKGQTARVRSLLAWKASGLHIAEELAGEPRRVVTAVELQEELQARIGSEAIASIWQETLLQPREVAVALGVRPGNREKVRSLRERSGLLGLPRERGFLYPAFQIDISRREIYPEVRDVNQALGAAEDPWGVASWWTSENDRLGTRPMDLVGSTRKKDLVEAASAAVATVG